MEVCSTAHLPIRGQLDFDKITICAMPAPPLQYVEKAITILVAPHDIVGYNVCAVHSGVLTCSVVCVLTIVTVRNTSATPATNHPFQCEKGVQYLTLLEATHRLPHQIIRTSLEYSDFWNSKRPSKTPTVHRLLISLPAARTTNTCPTEPWQQPKS